MKKIKLRKWLGNYENFPVLIHDNSSGFDRYFEISSQKQIRLLNLMISVYEDKKYNILNVGCEKIYVS